MVRVGRKRKQLSVKMVIEIILKYLEGSEKKNRRKDIIQNILRQRARETREEK